MNEERAREVASSCGEPIVVLDNERRIVATSERAAKALGGARIGGRLDEELAASHPDLLVLFLESPPELPAYQELRAGFTAAVSHELRTPLARLLVLLESAELPGTDLSEVVEQAREEVAQARELIDDVLFLGELETGREVVALGRTLAQPVVEEVVASLAERADHAQVTLEVRADGRVELPLRPRMLRVVLENLLANAIRYAGQGSTCMVELSESAEEDVLAVSDDGKGVEAADLPRLFERFYRGDQARTSRGTGLGLAIVKHVVTSAGGEIEAASDPGRGLRIRARFPR
ncbi:MAG TPA: HAMP domain-containing sensor histidine kinase [Gaiellaceae bacterium]|nr:HAMP domain-containing sensor histidine kinase [Gaiellaceae bacterium]